MNIRKMKYVKLPLSILTSPLPLTPPAPPPVPQAHHSPKLRDVAVRQDDLRLEDEHIGLEAEVDEGHLGREEQVLPQQRQRQRHPVLQLTKTTRRYYQCEVLFIGAQVKENCC